MGQEQEKPKQKDYTSNVYNALKQKVEGFNKTEDQFRKELSNPEYASKVHNALKSKVEGFDKSFDEFNSLIIKKKNVSQSSTSNSTSTTQNPKLVSGQKTGSSGTPKTVEDLLALNPKSQTSKSLEKQNFKAQKNIPSITPKEINRKDIAIPTKRESVVNKQAEVFEREQKMKDAEKFKVTISQYENDRLLTDEEKAEKIQEAEDEINGTGFVNTITDYGKKAWNVVSPVLGIALNQPVLSRAGIETDILAEDKETFIQNKKREGIKVSSLTTDEINKGAKEIYLKKKIDKAQEDKETLLIESLDDDTKKKLEINIDQKYGNLKDKDKLYYVRTENSKNRINELNNRISIILEKNKRGENLSEEEIDFAKNYETTAKELQKQYSDNYDMYNSNNKELGTVEQEHDMLNRSYHDGYNFLNKIALNSGRIALGFGQFENKMSELVLGETEESKKYSQDLSQFQNDIDNISQTEFAKQTEGLKSIDDSIKYVLNVVAEQLPNIMLMSASGGLTTALPTIGAYSTGNKMSELIQSNKEGKTNYTPSQIYATSILSGSAEMLETATIRNLLKFKRFVGALGSDATKRELLQKTFKDTAKTIFKGVGLEDLEETGTFVIQDFADTYILGKKTSFSEKKEQLKRILKDTTTLSVLMQGLPHATNALLKPFTSKNYVSELDKNSKEIARLTKELSNINLTDSDRNILQNSLTEVTNKSSEMINSFVEKTVNLTDENKDKLIELEDETSKLRIEAEEINKSKSISTEMKKDLLNKLKEKYIKSEELRNNIIEGKTTILDVVSESKKEEMKSNALKTLVAEKEGSNEAQFTNDVIEQKAIELHNQSNNNQISEPTETNTSEQVTEEIPTNNQITPSENASPINEVNNNQDISEEIKALENSRDVEIEDLKAKRQFNKQNVDGIKEKYNSLITQQKNKETEAKIKNKELFSDGGNFSNQLGDSGVNSVATNHTEINGIEFVQFSNPNTGMVDVVMSGTSDSDFVGYYRIYENGKPTDKWSSKFENQSRNKDNFKTMIGGVQSMLPEGHQYTETTSISTDGLRVWEQQLSRGYELQTDNNGNIVTNVVAINGDAINNELGIEVNQGNFDNISVTNNQQFESVKKALLPYLQKFGLNESNIRNVNGTVEIDLPVLRKTTKQNEAVLIQEVSPIKDNETITFYTGRDNKISDFSKTRGENIFFSKNKDISNWYGGDESNVTEANIDTSNFIDLTSQEKKTKFVQENFTDKDIEELYKDEIKNEEDRDRFGKKSRQELIEKYRKRAEENRFSGDGKEQNFLLKKIKEKGFSGVALKDSFFGKEDISYVVNDKSVIKTKNEKTPEGDSSANRNIPIGDNTDLQQREQQPEIIEVQSTTDVGESKSNAEIDETKQALVKSIKGGNYIVDFDENKNVTKIVSQKTGKEIRQFSEVPFIDKNGNKSVKLKKNANYSAIEADALGEKTDSKVKTERTKKLNTALQNFEPYDAYTAVQKFLASGGKMSFKSKNNDTNRSVEYHVGKNQKDFNWKFDENAPTLEEVANTISEETGIDIQKIQDELINEINSGNQKSSEDYIIHIQDSIDAETNENYKESLNNLSEEQRAYIQSIEDNEQFFEDLSPIDQAIFFGEKIKEANQFNTSENGTTKEEKSNDSKSNDKAIQGTNTNGTIVSDSAEQKPDNEKSKPKESEPTRKERVAERKKAVNSSIDELANALKDLLPKAPNTEGLKQNGLSQDDLINFIAESAKVLAGTTIEISEAINQVIEHLKSKGYDVDVDADEVLAKFQKEEKKQEKKELKEYDKDSFEVSASVVPNGETGEYLSGKTIEKYTGEKPQNDQEYLKVKLEEALLHGVSTINKAKEQFGNDFVSKVLEYLDTAPISPEAKALTYVSLENELNKNKKDGFPDDLTIQKKLDLVRAKRQAFARSNSLALNMNRLQKFAEAGFNPENLTDKFFSEKTKEAKKSIEETIQVTSKDVNSQDDIEQSGDISEDVKDLIQKGIDKEINEIYKKLPSSRRAKADKAINALEKIQKKLKANAYDATIGVPVAIIDGGISVIKNAIKAGVNIADAIELGINHIKDKYGKDWNNEDRFRKDMSEGFEAENVELKEKTKADESIKGIVKQALIGAGYSRNVKVNGETVKRLDWVKLAGEEGSVENIQNKVEEVLLKEGGYTKKQIAEMQDALKEEYNRLSADIIQKGLNELEKRNLIKPSPNRKSESKRLAELYNMGFLEENENEYDNLLNKVLGLSEFEQNIFNKIKAKTKALSDIYNAEVNGKKITEHSLQTVANDINHEIKGLLNTVSLSGKEEGFKKNFWKKTYKLITLLSDYGGLSQKALLGGLPNLIENVTSGRFAGLEQKLYTDKVLTPELRKQIKKDKKVIYNDITKNAGLYYGDTNTSLVSSSRFEDWVNGKTDNRVAHAVISAITLRSWLDGADSRAKVGLSSKLFIKNAVEILTSKSNPNGAMKREDAIKFVSESLTGDKFSEALETSKAIIDEVNSKQDKKQLKDTPEAIHRFAMNLVKENLMQDNRMTMEQIETAFKSGYKSAGRDIGHEANNTISRGVNLLNASLNRELEKAVSEKRFAEATMLASKMLIMRTIVNPFVGGGTNWVILGLEKSGNPLGYISTLFNATKKQELDLGTVSGIKNMSEALYRKNNYQASLTRNIIGTGVALALFAGMNIDIDDEEDAKDKLNKWLEENKWAKRYFEKLSPEALVFMISLENKELGKHLAKNLGINGDTFNNTSKLLKSLDKETTSTSGKAGQVVGSPLNSPLAWKTVKDVQNVVRGLKGLPEIKTDYKATGFWNGYFQGGLIEFVGMRPDKENTAEKPKEKSKYSKF